MIIDAINKITSSTGTLPPVLLDLTNDTVRERNLEREQTAHNAEGYQITGQMAIEDAEAWAVGQRNGVDVGSDDVTYNNNSKYYSTVSGSIMRMAGEQAQSAATNAQYAYESAVAAGESATTSGSCMRIAGESAESAEEAAVISGSYMRMAGESAEDSEAWAVGERGGEPVDSSDETFHNNSKYWSERAQEAATGIVPCGTCLFADLPSLASSHTGDMWNIEDAFTTTSDFREGAGIAVPPGANVYKTVDNKWDIMAGSTVTGVKGAAETEYRKGNVNLTPANLGLYPFSASTLSIGGYVPPSQPGQEHSVFTGNGSWQALDSTPTQNSEAPINSGGVYGALQPISGSIQRIGWDIGNLANLDTTAKNSIVAAINELAAAVARKGVHTVTKSSVSSLPVTITDPLVKANMKKVDEYLSNPAAQTGEWTITPANGSVTISGSISGTTNIEITLADTF